MKLEVKKPNEPIAVLLIAILAIILGLNLNFVSFKVISFAIYAYKGTQIIEAIVFFGLSVILALLAIIVYYFGNSQKMINLSKFITVIGVFPGLIGTSFILVGIYHFIAQTTDPKIDKLLLDSGVLSPDIGLAVCFGGLFLMGVAGYMLHNTNFKSGTKESVLYPQMSVAPINDEFSIENLKALWFCPNDRAKLEIIVNRTVPNPEFRVSNNRLDDNLNNAVAMRKLLPELVPYAKSLSVILLKKSKFPEIELVSTGCSTCHSKFVCPKLSDWYE